MSIISSKAIIDPGIGIAEGVSIGHFSIIEKDVFIGEGSKIAESVIIRANVSVGRDVIIHPHVVINSGATIGDRVEIFPGAYIGKEPKGLGILARQPFFEKRVVIQSDASIGCYAVIYYDVEIGEHTLIGDGASIREQCRIGSYSLIGRYVTINYNATVGNRTKILDMSHVTGNCKVGDGVFISMKVGSSNDNAIGINGYNEELIKGPIIEDGVRIGLAANLLPRVTIGKNAVVGAGSVVTKDVAPGSVVMGVPAVEKRRIES